MDAKLCVAAGAGRTVAEVPDRGHSETIVDGPEA